MEALQSLPVTRADSDTEESNYYCDFVLQF